MDDIINTDRSWVRDLERIFKYGNRSAPRGMPIYEMLAHQSIISMRNPVILNENRKLGYKFMAAEAAWILSGDDRVETIAPYSKDISNYSDDGVRFFGAYGPKIIDQIRYAITALYNDIDSRQAVINIWRENPGPTKDVPCTLSLQFLVRRGYLHCVASMRSSDMWLGHPYDIVSFSAISFMVMLELRKMLENDVDLGLQLGNLFMTCGSKHIYEKNAADVGKVIEHYGLATPMSTVNRMYQSRDLFVVNRYDRADEFVEHLWDCAKSGKGLLTMFDQS